jgi:hypothetical protein
MIAPVEAAIFRAKASSDKWKPTHIGFQLRRQFLR